MPGRFSNSRCKTESFTPPLRNEPRGQAPGASPRRFAPVDANQSRVFSVFGAVAPKTEKTPLSFPARGAKRPRAGQRLGSERLLQNLISRPARPRAAHMQRYLVTFCPVAPLFPTFRITSVLAPPAPAAKGPSQINFGLSVRSNRFSGLHG